jgi:ATP-dependent DNA helicase RecG
MTDTTDGFEIAERDLRLRGPGDLFGTRQAGMPTFRLVDLGRDRELLDAAHREAAAAFDPGRAGGEAVAALLRHWHERFGLMGIG